MISVEQKADVPEDALTSINDAVVCRLVNHLAVCGVYGVYEAVTQFSKFLLRLLLVTAVVHVAHRTIFSLIFKYNPIPHNNG